MRPDPDLAAVIAPHLEAHERVLWSQRAPLLGNLFGALFHLVFCMVWAGFAWTWTALAAMAIIPALIFAWRGWEVLIAPLFLGIGGLFSVIGLAILVSAIGDLLLVGRHAYALTSLRVLVIAGRTASSFGPEAFRQTATTGSGGRGDILFGWSAATRGGGGFTQSLRGVREPREVERAIRHVLGA